MIGKFLFVLLIALLAFYKISAQGIPVIDVAHIAFTIANGVKLDDQLDNQIRQIEEAKRIFEKVDDIKELQYEVQEALKMVESVKDLKWSNIAEEIFTALDLSIEPHYYIGAFPLADRLSNAYNQPNIAIGAMDIFNMLSGFNSDEPFFQTYMAFQNSAKENATSQYAFSEMADKKKIQTALSFNLMAEQMLEKADEMRQVLLINERFSMTEAERLTSLKLCNDYILESFELKLQSDELIRSVLEDQNELKKLGIRMYSNDLFRESIAIIPQYKFGE